MSFLQARKVLPLPFRGSSLDYTEQLLDLCNMFVENPVSGDLSTLHTHFRHLRDSISPVSSGDVSKIKRSYSTNIETVSVAKVLHKRHTTH